MKKTQRKDAWKNITRDGVSYLSIFVIALLAVAAFCGINFAARALKENANRYYKALNFRDFELVSTLLLDEEDLLALRELEGVADVEGVFQTSGKAQSGDQNKSVTILSVTSRINRTQLLSGELPQTDGECAVEKELAEMLGLAVGDTLMLSNARGEAPDYLLQSTYRICGIVLHPDHYTRTFGVPEDRLVLVAPEAFDQETLSGSCMKALVSIEKDEDASYFDESYLAAVSEVRGRLEAYGGIHEVRRAAAVGEIFEERIQDAEETLARGWEQLSDGRRQLDENTALLEDGIYWAGVGEALLAEGKKELENGEQELAQAQTALAEARAQLDAGEAILAAGEAQLSEAYGVLEFIRGELDGAAALLSEGNAQLVSGYNQAEGFKETLRVRMRTALEQAVPGFDATSVDWAEPSYISDASDPNLSIYDFALTSSISVKLRTDSEETLDDAVHRIFRGFGLESYAPLFLESGGIGELRETYREYASLMDAWEEGHRQYVEGLAAYNEGLSQYNEGLRQYEAARAEFEAGRSQYEEGLRQYEEGVALYETGQAVVAEGWKTYEEKTRELKEGREKIRSGQEALAFAEREYDEALSQYEEGRQTLERAKDEGIPACHLVVLDVTGNAGYVHARDSADNVSKLGVTFAALFMVLGALVIYATVGRMVDEQRSLVGTQKALGLLNREILAKYLVFGVSASVLGVLAGTLFAYTLIQRITTSAHEQFYVTSRILQAFSTPHFLGAAIGAVLVSVFSVVWACAQMLGEPARALMQAEVPKTRKNGGRAETRTGDGGASLYSRLIVRNMQTDLPRVLITVVSIAGSCALLMIGFTLRDGVHKAVSEQFDEILRSDAVLRFDPEAEEGAEEMFREALSEAGIRSFPALSVYRSYDTGDRLSLAEILCGDPEDLAEAIRMTEADGDTTLALPDSGVLIQWRTAASFGFTEGEDVTIYDGEMNPHTARVAGIIRYYFGRTMYFSRDAYRETFGEEPVNNAFYLFTDMGKEEIEAVVKDLPGYESLTTSGDTKEVYENAVSVINMVTLVLIFSAGLMAFFVLLNLVNMYLNKKKRELTIMRINGFSTREVIRYVSMESVVTTLLGILLGYGIGALLGDLILRLLEQPTAGFGHGFSLTAMLISGALTALFSVVINAIALRKVRDLKLSDVA